MKKVLCLLKCLNEMEDEDKENMMMADAPGITFTTSEKVIYLKL
jgi:hypothetical protein